MQTLETFQNKIAFSSLLKRYTLEEFWELPEPTDRSHYELSDWKVSVSELFGK
jgi:hypothetical protein